MADFLLLGSGESGKSTIVKQMKIIHQNGYSQDELRAWTGVVYKNLMESAQALVVGMRKFNMDFEDEKNEVKRIATHASEEDATYSFCGLAQCTADPGLPFERGCHESRLGSSGLERLERSCSWATFGYGWERLLPYGFGAVVSL